MRRVAQDERLWCSEDDIEVFVRAIPFVTTQWEAQVHYSRRGVLGGPSCSCAPTGEMFEPEAQIVCAGLGVAFENSPSLLIDGSRGAYRALPLRIGQTIESGANRPEPTLDALPCQIV